MAAYCSQRIVSTPSIFPLVDHQQQIESIIDPGSQIIAMAKEICMELGLIYDAAVILNMQSANGEVDRSLGLARNVPIQIGERCTFKFTSFVTQHMTSYSVVRSTS